MPESLIREQVSGKSPFAFTALLIAAAYFFTGFTSLAYEILWVRMLSLIFGVNIFGVAITVAAFMAGLGVGGFLGVYLVRRKISPLLMFALLEAFIAIFAFLLPKFIPEIENFVYLNTAQNSWGSFFLLESFICFVLLFIPAVAMGSTFALLLEVLKPFNISVGQIYGINTLGGVLGSITPIYLLPVFGWIVSTRLIAILGLLIAALCFVLSFFVGRSQAENTVSRNQETSSVKKSSLIAYAFIGLAALMLQISWVRLYGMVLLRTEYILAMLLAIFLMGIGVGAFMHRFFQKQAVLAVIPLLIAFFGLLSILLLPLVSAWAETANFQSFNEAILSQFFILLVIFFPVTFLFGIWFPVLIRHISGSSEDAVLLYGANSIGGALGALIATFILLPVFGSVAIIYIAVLVVIFSSFTWVSAKWYQLSSMTVLLLGLFILGFPPVSSLLPQAYANAKDIFYYEDAVSLTSVVDKPSGERLLLSDLQRMDASSEPTAVTVQKNQARLALLLHREPKEVLFLGLGTGITASGALAFPGVSVTAVELSAGAIAAAGTYFSSVNLDVTEKIRIIKDDARRYTKLTQDKFDVVIGDLFHPDLVGRGALLSVEHFARIKGILRSEGLFVQWVALNQYDVESLKIVLSTFRSVFPHSAMFLDGFRLALVGSNAKMSFYASMRAHQIANNDSAIMDKTGGEGIWTWLGRYIGEIEDEGVLVQSEWSPKLEFLIPQSKYDGKFNILTTFLYVLSMRSAEQDIARELAIPGEGLAQFVSAFKATNLWGGGMVDSLRGEFNKGFQKLREGYMLNNQDRWLGFGIADQMYASKSQAQEQGLSPKNALLEILKIRPDHYLAIKDLGKIAETEGNLTQSRYYKSLYESLNPQHVN